MPWVEKNIEFLYEQLKNIEFLYEQLISLRIPSTVHLFIEDKTHWIPTSSAAQKSQQEGDVALSDEEKPGSDDKDGNRVVEDGKEEESQHTEKDSEEPMET